MTVAPSLPDQIAELNEVSELLAANGGAIIRNGFGDELDRAQIALARQRALLEHCVRSGVLTGEDLRAALAKSGNDGIDP
jgi:hypothetical protein